MLSHVYGLRVESEIEYRYIGKTNVSVRSRYMQHLRTAKYGSTLPVYNWIRKTTESGLSIAIDVLDSCEVTVIDKLEMFYIEKYTSLGHSLLNLTAGGSGTYQHKHSEEQKLKWSEDRKGSISGDRNPNWGKFGPEHPSYGRKISEEIRMRLSQRMLGENNPNYGKPLSEETRKKMSIVRKGIPKPSSARSAHTRWHTNKNVTNPNCTWCLEKEEK